MTDNKIIAPSQFRRGFDAQEVADIGAPGVIGTDDNLDQFDLNEVQYGETIVGTLSAEERRLYVSYHKAFLEFDAVNREFGAGLMSEYGSAIREGTEEEFLRGQLGVDPETVKTLFRAARRMEFLRSMVFWHLGERYDIHEFAIGVRRGGRIVKGQRKVSVSNG